MTRLIQNESWARKKAERQRIDAFELWCWRRLLRVPWTARRSNQSVLKEINPDYSLEGLVLKLKLQYCGHLMWRASSLEKTLMLGKIEGRRRGNNRGWDGWMASPTQWTWVWASSGSWWWSCKPGMLQSMWSQRVRHDRATKQQQNGFWTETVHSFCNIQRGRKSCFRGDREQWQASSEGHPGIKYILGMFSRKIDLTRR